MILSSKYPMGHFSVLDTDGLSSKIAGLMDGGAEMRHKENYYFDNNKRPGYGGYLLQYTLSGNGIFEKHGIRHEMKKEIGFFVRFPEDSRYYLPKEFETPWIFLYLHFTGEALAPYVDRLENICDGIFSLSSSSKSIRMLLHLQERMCDGEKLKKYEGTEFIFRFFCTLLREIEVKESENASSITKRAVEIMNEEYRELESIQRLAEHLNITQEHLCRLFKSEMELSPGQYLTNLRIQSAMHDLLNTTENLEDIARKNGFSNANYFGKVFKKRVGTTPIQYRNME